MAETTLLDAHIATRKVIMGRTFSWGTTPPTGQQVNGQLFIDTTLKGIYQYNETLGIFEDVMLSEPENISLILALV